jgi:hypothetical protein
MSKIDAWEHGLLLLVFNNVNFALVGDATGLRGSSTPGNFYVSLHTADPTETGNQSTNEISYTGYARQAVARASGAGGWTVTSGSVSPTSPITYPESTGGAGGVATHLGIGTAASGAGLLLYKGFLSPTIPISSGVTPQLTTATVISED